MTVRVGRASLYLGRTELFAGIRRFAKECTLAHSPSRYHVALARVQD